jgi:uncharacterized protein YcfL
LYVACVLLVVLILLPFIFTNPVFLVLTPKIPSIFPVKVTYKTSTKKNAKAKTKKLTYTMKVAKVGVTLSGDSVVAIGSTTKLTNTKKNSSRAKITYTSSDDSIATVAADGTVTGVKAGKATITAKITVGKDSATTTKDVEVKNYVLSTVAQNKLTELTATVTGNTKNLKPTDFVVKNETTNVVYPVSKVSVDSKDASKVTLTLFSELKDAATYDVTLDGITKTFVASDGKVASIALDTATIPYATETEVKLVSKDANGVIVKEMKLDETDANYSFTIDPKGNGYTNGSKLYLNKIGDTAEATIEYKTGKYDQNGKPEGNIGPNKVTITAADQATVNGFAVRIDAAGKKFDKAKDTNKIAKGETKVAYIKITDANGKEVSDYNNYSVESSDKASLMVSGSLAADPHCVYITAVKNGAAYLLIKKDNKIVGSVAIDVVAERTVATLELDKYSVTVSKSADLKNAIPVKATVKDQYGDDIDATLTVECLSTDVKNLKAANVTGDTYYTYDGKKTVTFNYTADAGNYVYKISYKKDGKEVVAKTVSVAVKTVDTSKVNGWKIDVSNVDLKVDKDNKAAKDVVLKVIGTNNGVDATEVKADSWEVKDKDGKVVTTTPSGSAIKITAVKENSTVSGGAITALEKKLAVGTYSVKAIVKVDGKDVVLTTSFTVSDSQSDTSAVVEKQTVAADGKTVEDALQKAITVKYGDKTYGKAGNAKNDDIIITKVTGISNIQGAFDTSDKTKTPKNLTKGEYFTDTKVTVCVEVEAGVYMLTEVSVPGYITIE